MRRAARGWVVIGTLPFADRRAPFTAGRCLARDRPVHADRDFRVYAPE